MDFTLVVCTRNRGRQLEMCLNSITRAINKNQDKEIEVLIVDNASSDNTEDVAKSWAKANWFPTRVISENRPGLARARNAAVRSANGKLIIFTDDDCTLSANYFRKVVQYYVQDKGPVIRGGRVELGNPVDADFTTKRSVELSRVTDITQLPGFILGCNMVIPREIIVSLGYFDERFGAGALFKSGEETEFFCRAHIAGVPIEYVPDLLAFHHHGRRNIKEIKRLFFAYCIGNGAIYGKYCRTERRLLHRLYWDARKAIFEASGGETIDRNLGLTYRSAVIGSLVGFVLYGVSQRRILRARSGVSPTVSTASGS
jgi:glycosyltransferase involved in cell wall biosynthesis